MVSIRVLAADGSVRAEALGTDYANLLFEGAYNEGDRIEFRADASRVRVKVDSAVEEARVYLAGGAFTYRLPLSGDNLSVYAPGAFMGNRHLISIRPDGNNERRNVALNPADQRGDVTAYPHATANVETRNESVFCARNVIDGITLAAGHGRWPYESWGIGARTDACLTLDFGRDVAIDEMILYLRADFPHDAYWIQASVTLSNGFVKTFPLEGADGPQRIELGEQIVRWLKLDRLIKCDNPSAFPSLRQLEVYGRDAED